MVMTRKKIEQKIEVVMIVETNKKGREIGKRGNISELIRLGCCGIVIAIHLKTTITTPSPIGVLMGVGSHGPTSCFNM
jgi:hypothetical protein